MDFKLLKAEGGTTSHHHNINSFAWVKEFQENIPRQWPSLKSREFMVGKVKPIE